MNTSVATVILMCLLVSMPIVNGFYLFFPQANDRIMALEVADQVVAKQLASDGDLLVDPEEAMMEAKRASSSRGSVMRRRSAGSYACPCLHKVCTYHCMTK
ncbi:U-scoloptoxin(04)- [Caenorhabditis elegans]|uniref:U-scoloptoxin(04) n=1 Tax=Caenorhabditis elegans TaxID=6239 RepID=Q8IG32_CAEEL|nr:U-scoloptoxin(04)- [Caenorhabditis elegans]CCD68768.1 U-scoloptoxin(04)- [Caenorhabditis elegans]|eukprot:NP_872053.2 Uncharacterized protein CELE_F09E5.16 [Caenorhabditis elegans]